MQGFAVITKINAMLIGHERSLLVKRTLYHFANQETTTSFWPNGAFNSREKNCIRVHYVKKQTGG